MMYDTDTLVHEAKAMGIHLTNAHFGSPLCDMWEDRVACAIMHRDAGRHEACAQMIREANRVAI